MILQMLNAVRELGPMKLGEVERIICYHKAVPNRLTILSRKTWMINSGDFAKLKEGSILKSLFIQFPGEWRDWEWLELVDSEAHQLLIRLTRGECIDDTPIPQQGIF